MQQIVFLLVIAGVCVTGLPAPSGQITQAQARDIFDTLGSALTSVWSGVIQKPIETALQNGALMLAQLLAGLGTDGINLSSIFGGRSSMDARDFFDIFGSAITSVWTDVIQKPIETALQNGALMLAQLLAGVGTNGINLSSIFGGRSGINEAEFRGFWDSVLSGVTSIWTDVIQKPVEGALQTSALLLAQLLAGIGTEGISLGKRELVPELRGPIIDSLTDHATGLFQNTLKPIIESALSNVAINMAQILANFSQTGVIG
ncbi:unnamed protein product [Didymodactylos carnosus]|uniref:Uncharacterized protein n=1 Tax=Didymodactylos carnosus TaxID=1234261 RepID=A0A814PW43_9BILA|nr:unnamed protein product [Didymodactylos carnosus]CAF3875648.1 unnamed protein product [Didymodactylos carnosus]